MATRQFIFCDICNTMGIRLIEERRSHLRLGGRRRVDDRSWVEGGPEDAKSQGWLLDAAGRDVCIKCHARGLELDQYQRLPQPVYAGGLSS